MSASNLGPEIRNSGWRYRLFLGKENLGVFAKEKNKKTGWRECFAGDLPNGVVRYLQELDQGLVEEEGQTGQAQEEETQGDQSETQEYKGETQAHAVINAFTEQSVG